MGESRRVRKLKIVCTFPFSNEIDGFQDNRLVFEIDFLP